MKGHYFFIGVILCTMLIGKAAQVKELAKDKIFYTVVRRFNLR
jgi:hypothetical protein